MERLLPRILVTLDGSALAAAAIPVAAKLAADLDAEVVLLRVIPPPRAADEGTARDLLPAVDRAEQQAAAGLRVEAAAFDGLHVTPVVLVGSDPAAGIVGWLRRHPVDYVVMATHGHGGLRHLVAGSVTEAVLRSGLAPVLAVRPTAAAARRRRSAA